MLTWSRWVCSESVWVWAFSCCWFACRIWLRFQGCACTRAAPSYARCGTRRGRAQTCRWARGTPSSSWSCWCLGRPSSSFSLHSRLELHCQQSPENFTTNSFTDLVILRGPSASVEPLQIQLNSDSNGRTSCWRWLGRTFQTSWTSVCPSAGFTSQIWTNCTRGCPGRGSPCAWRTEINFWTLLVFPGVCSRPPSCSP